MFILKALVTALVVTGIVIGSPTPTEKRQATAIIWTLESLATDLAADATAIASAAPGDVGAALTGLVDTLTSADTVLSGLSPIPGGILNPAAASAVINVVTALADVIGALGTAEDEVPETVSTINDTVLPAIATVICDIARLVPGAPAVITTILDSVSGFSETAVSILTTLLGLSCS